MTWGWLVLDEGVDITDGDGIRELVAPGEALEIVGVVARGAGGGLRRCSQCGTLPTPIACLVSPGDGLGDWTLGKAR